jgi:branched-chain amino acid transport system substrate-binding protein
LLLRNARFSSLNIGVVFMSIRNTRRKALGAVAVVAAASLAVGVSLPASAASADKTLKITSILPLTGALAFLYPPMEAGANLAIDDINKAGGVLGNKVQFVALDSGDGTNLSVSTQSATTAISNGSDVVLGAAASGVTRNIINQITGHKIVEISPSNTAPDLSTWNDGGYYFRTAPSDNLQGRIIANQILTDGAQNVAILYANNSYGTGLEGVAEATLKKAGATVNKYSFTEGETNFDSIVSNVTSGNPDAILVISYDETKKALPALKSAGFSGGNVYLVDGNTIDYSGESFASYLNGAKGTIPGGATTAAFKNRLKAEYKKLHPGQTLSDFTYAAESYDAVVLAALAAQASGKATGAGIKSQLTNVSLAGAGKTTVTSFAAGLKALKAGKKINYDGFSGPVEFDKNGDPTGAFIGIYRYDSHGVDHLVRTVSGNTK